MPDPLPWPPILVSSSEDWSLRGGTRTGGQTFEGNEQTVASPTSRWKASLKIPCFTRDHVLAMRRVIALGRTAVWFLGPCEATRAPWNIDLVGGRITYGRAAQRPDLYVGDQSPTLDFRLAGAAALNATTISLQRHRGGVLEPGMLLQFGDRRMHVIVGLDGETDVPGQQGAFGTVMTLAIRPWLRAAYPDGDAIEFGRPVCTMRLASDDTGAMELQLSRLGTVTLDLVEAF